MAKQLRIRPSELYHIEDEVIQWSFDRAVQTFGNALESKLQLISRSSKKQKEAERKTQNEFRKWIYSADPAGAKGRFRDPTAAR